MEENRDAGQVVVWGAGLESGKVRAGVPATFHVDATKADEAPLTVDVITEKGEAPMKGLLRGCRTVLPRVSGVLKAWRVWLARPQRWARFVTSRSSP